MYQLDVPLDIYNKLKQCLSEIHPEINVILVSCDYSLASLGFVIQPPCLVNVDLTKEVYQALMDELMQYEIDAYNQDSSYHIIEKSPEYRTYLRYGWMWDYFYSAEYIE